MRNPSLIQSHEFCKGFCKGFYKRLYKSDTHKTRRSVLRAVAAIFALLCFAALPACNQGEQHSEAGRSGKTVRSGNADIGGDFTLIDHNETPVTQADLLGKPHLIYFGFTYCPDVCPTALQKMGAAQSRLGDLGQEIGYVLVSIDPERDRPELLRDYITAAPFPQGLQAFTGTQAQIDTAKAAYKVYAAKAPLGDSAADYTMDHSDIIYLMGKDGIFKDYFSNRSTPQDIEARIRQLLVSGE